ncbi:DUF222 domain-containing protein [Cryobacterium psychrophilum]|uniref:DUF222 domain-containing protein n=1 Tax=Cryobacterium psychrophilum TaxID=41988 RepID=A0A4Y8KPG0_9MICO|nr:DUF222 domain-containing protein [Cryobacterium psychrophilum]TFD80467.1 DUF222 domain-containing protein [Cryobacterium psychrophilum]
MINLVKGDAQVGALIDRVMYVEKVIVWAQASRVEAVDRAFTRATDVAQTGKATGTDRWDARYAAERAMTAEIACALRIPQSTAAGLWRESRCLTHALPLTLAALRAGQISARHAQRMIDHVASIPSRSQREFEAAALPFAVTLTVSKFDLKARLLREGLHPGSLEGYGLIDPEAAHRLVGHPDR